MLLLSLHISLYNCTQVVTAYLSCYSGHRCGKGDSCVAPNFSVRFAGWPQFCPASCNAHVLSDQQFTRYLCMYPARAHIIACSLSCSHSTLQELSSCRAATCSSSPLALPSLLSLRENFSKHRRRT